MRELRTSGSEGGPGRQPPRPTRLTTSAPKAFYVTAAVSASLRRPTSFAPPTRCRERRRDVREGRAATRVGRRVTARCIGGHWQCHVSFFASVLRRPGSRPARRRVIRLSWVRHTVAHRWGFGGAKSVVFERGTGGAQPTRRPGKLALKETLQSWRKGSTRRLVLHGDARPRFLAGLRIPLPGADHVHPRWKSALRRASFRGSFFERRSPGSFPCASRSHAGLLGRPTR